LFYGLTSLRSWPRGASYVFRCCLFFSGAQEGFAVFLDKKVTKKSSQQIGFFAAQAFALQIGQNHGCNYFALLRSHFPDASAKTCYASAAAQASIVLPAFTRSLPADGNILYLSFHG
jgi:hypothetical protein